MNNERVFSVLKKDLLWPAAILLAWIAPFLLLTHRLEEPLGGFQSALEATNMLTAEHFADSSLLFPSLDGKETYLETPGLYPYLIHLFSGFHSKPLVVARVLSLLSFFGISLMLYLIGTRIRSRMSGFLAAFLYTCLPISILLGRNIQGDSVALFFFLTALWLYLWGNRTDREGAMSIISLFGPALLFALAACTHYLVWFGAFAWLVWIRQAYPEKAFFADKRNRINIFLGAGLPLTVYLIQAISVPSAFFDGFFGTFRVNTPFLFFRSLFLQKEFFWALSPLIALSILGACFFYVRRKELRHPLLTYMAIAQLFPFLFFAKYSFYLLPAAPFLILILSLVLDELRGRGFRQAKWPIVGILLLSGFFVSLSLTVHSKYGYHDLSDAKRLLSGANEGNNDGIVLVDGPLLNAYDRELRYYFRKDSLVRLDRAVTDDHRQLVLSNLSVRLFLHPYTKESASSKAMKRTEYIANWYGNGLQIQKRLHFFQVDSWKTIGNLPRFFFYLQPLEEIPILEGSLYSPSTKVFLKDNQVLFQEN